MASDEVDVLLAERAIRDVLHNYCRGVDSIDAALLSTVFAEECVVDYGPSMGGPRQGREAIVAGLVAGLPRYASTHHQVSNIQLCLDGDEAASGVTYVTAWHRFEDGRPDAVFYGQYHDRFVKTAEGWRIVERRLFSTGNENFDVEWRMIPRLGRN